MKTQKMEKDSSDSEDDITMTDSKIINKKKRKSKNKIISDSSDSEWDTTSSSDSEDDIPISHFSNPKKRKRNNGDDLPNMKRRKLSDSEGFGVIFAGNNIDLAVAEYNKVKNNRININLCALKETEILEMKRDIAIELVAKYKPEMNGGTVIDAENVKCFKCGIDPKDMEWELLLCEYCPVGAAHCSCVSPCYASVPDGKWACHCCQQQIIGKYYKEFMQSCVVRQSELERKWTNNERLLQNRMFTAPKPNSVMINIQTLPKIDINASPISFENIFKEKKSANVVSDDIDEEWPIENVKIVLNPIGSMRRKEKKRFQIVGCYPEKICSDYYYSPLLLEERDRENMFRQ